MRALVLYYFNVKMDFLWKQGCRHFFFHSTQTVASSIPRLNEFTKPVERRETRKKKKKKTGERTKGE